MKNHASGRPEPSHEQSDLAARIVHVATLSLDELRAAWRAEFRRDPPRGLYRDLLIRTLAWRLQEKAFGGHDKATLRLLDAYARGKGDRPMFRRLKAGTVLIREYQGTRHTVMTTHPLRRTQGRRISRPFFFYESIGIVAWTIGAAFKLRARVLFNGRSLRPATVKGIAS